MCTSGHKCEMIFIYAFVGQSNTANRRCSFTIIGVGVKPSRRSYTRRGKIDDDNVRATPNQPKSI